MLHKLSEKLRDEVGQKSAEGLSSEKIAKWLLDKHKITLSRGQISKYLRAIKKERKEIAVGAYTKAAADNANQDLEIIGELITKFHAQVMASMEAEDLLIANKLSETLLKYISKRIDLSGMNLEDNDDEKLKEINKIREEWLKRLNESK